MNREAKNSRADPAGAELREASSSAAVHAEGRSLSSEESQNAHRRAWAIVASRPHLKVPDMEWRRHNLPPRVRGGRVELPETPDGWPAVGEETVKKFGWDAEERGEARGIARGIVKGEAKGIAKGEAQVLDGARRHVVREIRDRFGPKVADHAQAFLGAGGRIEPILAVYGWALTCQSQTELLDRLTSA